MFLRLLLLFTVVPLVELFLLVKLGTVIGIGATILIVICTGVLGAWLARWQGLGVLRRLTEDVNQGRLPADALIDGLLILIAGAVLLTPGLITDALGFLAADKKTVRIDAAGTAEAIADILKQGGAGLAEGDDPCALPKA